MRISALPNLGPVVEGQLREVGIETVDDLRAAGALAAYAQLRFVFGRRISIIALYALDGALTGHDWRRLPPGRREELRAAATRLTAAP